jgi:hypothetical protein
MKTQWWFKLILTIPEEHAFFLLQVMLILFGRATMLLARRTGQMCFMNDSAWKGEADNDYWQYDTSF